MTGVLAPTTVITSLLFYFGYVTLLAQYAHFGVDIDALGLSVRDVLLRSPSVLFVPVLAVLAVSLAALWVHAAVRHLLRTGPPPVLRRAGTALVILGVLLLGYGTAGVLVPSIAENEPIAATPAALGLGTVAVAYGGFVRRAAASGGRVLGWRAPVLPQLLLIGGVLTLSLFWVTNSFAAAYGEGRALGIAEDLDERPAVVLDVQERLWLPEGVVEETALSEPGSGDVFRYRYRGLRLLVVAGGRMWLVPEAWGNTSRTTLVVPLDASVRVHFVP